MQRLLGFTSVDWDIAGRFGRTYRHKRTNPNLMGAQRSTGKRVVASLLKANSSPELRGPGFDAAVLSSVSKVSDDSAVTNAFRFPYR
jgi:hypothetical protein